MPGDEERDGDCLRLSSEEKEIDELKARVAQLERENAALRAHPRFLVKVGADGALHSAPISTAHCKTFSASGPPVANGEYCDEEPGCVLPRGHGRTP